MQEDYQDEEGEEPIAPYAVDGDGVDGRAVQDDAGEMDDGDGCLAEEPSRPLLSGVPLTDCDHGELLRVIIGEGAEAAMETFFEAKDPNIDPMLKLKLIGLASNVGDNVRKAIATHAAHFGGKC